MAQNQPSLFGALLRQYRMTVGWTQEELAERARISARTVSDLERGIASRPHIPTVRRLADALGLSEDDHHRLLDARLTARDTSTERDKTATDRSALHIVSSDVGPWAAGAAGNGARSGAATLPSRERDAVVRTAIRPVASLATHAGIVRPSASTRKAAAAVGAFALVILAVTFVLFAVSRSFGIKTASSAVLVGRIDPYWPLPGSAPGILGIPSAVAVDVAGTVYVADTGNDRVDRFAAGGRFLDSFGLPGSGQGQFRRPRGIAVDGLGHVYVSDTGNDRIQKFSPGGKWLASWGTRGHHPGQFRSPQGLAMDSSGNLYVADRDNNRIQEFSRSGVFLHAWGPGIPTGPDLHPPPELYRPLAVALDPTSNIYVVDGGHVHVHEFSPYAVPLGDWGQTGPGRGRLVDPTAIAVEADGTVVVGQGAGTPLVEYDATSHTFLGWQPRSRGIHAAGIALDGHGSILVADMGTARILRLDRIGNVTAQFGHPPMEPAGLSAPGALTVGQTGDLYVADTGHRRVVRLDSGGRPVKQLGRGALGFPRSVAVDRDTGDLYVLDSALGRVRRFSAGGKLLASWGGLDDPHGIAVDATGNVYVTDDAAGTVQKFTGSGALLATRTIAPPDISNGIGAIAADQHGATYVAVPSQDVVLKFSPAGQMLAQWRHFHGDLAVAVDRLDHVFVADAGRFQEFSPSGQVLRVVRLPGSVGRERTPAEGIAVDAKFDVFVSDGLSNRVLKFSPGAPG